MIDFNISESKPIFDLQEYSAIKDNNMPSLKDFCLKPSSIEYKPLSTNLENEESKDYDSNNLKHYYSVNDATQSRNRSCSQQKETRKLAV